MTSNCGWVIFTSIGDPVNTLPKDFSLAQNYPNPFNPSTKISFEISKSSMVSLKVYDVNGRLVNVLLNEHKNAGSYSVNFNAGNLSSGIYFYTLSSSDISLTKKMLLVK